MHTVQNIVISPNFLVWKFCRNAETVLFHKIVGVILLFNIMMLLSQEEQGCFGLIKEGPDERTCSKFTYDISKLSP